LSGKGLFNVILTVNKTFKFTKVAFLLTVTEVKEFGVVIYIVVAPVSI